MSFANLNVLSLGELKDNYEKDATGTTALWPTTQLYKAEVPAGKRWFLIGGQANRAVSSTLVVTIKNALDEIVLILANYSAGTGYSAFPTTSASVKNLMPNYPIPMGAGWYVSASFGTAQDANSYASAIILEVTV